MKRLLITACAAALLNCSGGSSTADGGTDAMTNGDGPSGGDAGGDGATSSSKPYTGFVDLNLNAANTVTYTATPVFFTTPDAGSSGACTGTQSGSCCYRPPSDAGLPTAPTPVSAGTVTLTDGTATLATFTPTGTTYTAVSDPPTTALTWKDGDTVKAVGAGATVHAFSGSVGVASRFAGVKPALSLTTATVIKRSTDFTITWTAATGDIIFGIQLLKGATPDGSINCEVSTDTGTMTVPTALLMNVAATDTAELSLQRISSVDASNDNATITLASTAAVGGRATFQ